MSRDVKDEIRQEVEQNRVVIYMKGTQDFPQCGFSARAVGLLKTLGVPIKDVNVLEDPEKWKAVKEYSDWPTIPQVYVGGTFVGGGDQLVELQANGELEALVRKGAAGA